MSEAAAEYLPVAAEALIGSAGPPLLELRSIYKQFPGVKVLQDVSFSVCAGQVHMLVGENGAGKSTLIKILYGALQADSGEYIFNGEVVSHTSPQEARLRGIAVIFQEFSLVPSLSVADNIFLGRELMGWLPGVVDRKREHAEARQLLSLVGLSCDPRTPVQQLGVAQQQMVEIAKALSQNAKILVMDEPTAALSDREANALFAVVRRLKSEGVGIVYVSHRMIEVMALGDDITVLRDGRKVATVRPADVDLDEVVRLMIGRPVDRAYRRKPREPGPIALGVSGLTLPSGPKDINLTVAAGEIVGLCGLVGSGRTETVRAIFGLDPRDQGELTLFGEPLGRRPDQIVRQGVGLIPESRKLEGLALIQSIQDNLLASSLWKLFPNSIFKQRSARRSSVAVIHQLRIATPSGRRLAAVLSGGNQQKVVIGKWLLAGCRLFLFDEPTRGIDIGAKEEIFALIDALVQEGAAVLMISSELPEVVQVCDRAYVMRDGRIAGHLNRDQLSEHSILQLAMAS